MELMDESNEERIVQRSSTKEKRNISDLSSRTDKGNNSGVHDDLYFEQEDEYAPEVEEKYMHWKGQRRGGSGRYRSRWPSGRRVSSSYGRSRMASRGTRRADDLDEGEIFEIDAENMEGNEVLDEWVVEGTEFANDGSLIVEEYVLDDESLQAGLQRYNTKYQRGRGGFRRPSSSRARKSFERQRAYEKYEIIDEKTFGNYASRSRARSPHYHDNENYRESYDAEMNPHGSREWSKRGWTRDESSGYRKKSRSPDNPRAEGERYRDPEREDAGKQYYESRYHTASKSLEGGESPVGRRKGSGYGNREEGSPVAEKGEYSPVVQKQRWLREQSPGDQTHNQERSWSRNRRELSPPAAYKIRSQSPLDKRRGYSPSLSDKRESTPKRLRGKDIPSPKKRGRSGSPHQRGSTVSSGKGGQSVSPVGRKPGKGSRKRERSPHAATRKRGRSSSSSSSQGDRSSRSGSRDSQEREASRDEAPSAYSSRAGGRSRDPRRSGGASSGGHPSQHGQDQLWKQPAESAHDYSTIHQQHQQFGMEAGGMAQAAPSAVYPGTYSTYGAQPDMSASAYHQAGHAGYDIYNYQAYYQQSAMQPSYGGEFSAHQVPPDWSDAGLVLPDMTQPPPLQHQMQGSHETDPELKADYKKSEEARKEAIKKEQKEQKLTLIKQREEYYKKSSVLMRELELLREQKEELLEEKSCDNDRILKENGKLQLEIQNKLKAINNVIDMLTGIIGDKKDKKDEKRKSAKDDGKIDKHKSLDSKTKAVVEEDEEEESEEPVYNYVYYDPEVHWCRVCDVFPRTAKEYLHHLHCPEHKELTAKKKMVDMPWHKTKPEQEVPYYKGAPTKRTSIKGLQFLISVSSWYCKLCDTWIGDLHCVSLHLKSKLHMDNYKEFTDKNPKWELEWLAEREQAFQRKNEEKLLLRDGPSKDHSPMDFESKMKEEQDSEDERESKLVSKVTGKEKTKSSGGTWAEVVAAPARTTRIPTTTALGGVAHRTKPRTVLGGDDSSESEEGEVKMGRSIRVSMRNKPKMTILSDSGRNSWTTLEKEGKGTLKVKGEVGDSDDEMEVQKNLSSRREEKSFQEWMPKAPTTISDDDRQLLSNIKDRLKQKQEAEKERDEEREKVEEKDRKMEREKYEAKKVEDKPKAEHDRGYERGRSWDRDRSTEKEWYRDRRERDRSRERKRSRTKRYGSTSPRRRSPERRNRYERKYESYKDRKRDRVDFRSDSRGDREVREEKGYPGKVAEEIEKKFDPFSKKEKKPEPKPIKVPKKPPDPNCPKTKLPFIGRMPLLKHIAKKKGPGGGLKGEDGKDEPDGEGGVSGTSPSHEGGKDASLDEMGKVEGVQDMDIDDDNSDGELPDSQEKDNDYHQDEDMNVSKDGVKQDVITSAAPGTETSSHLLSATPEAATNTAPVATKVSRFGPLMEMSSGPKLLTSFDQPTGVQVQLCTQARLAAVQAAAPLVPPGTTAEGNSSVTEAGEAKPKKVVDEIPLPKDFQDALNILFPEKSAMGEQNPLAPPGVSTPPGESGDQEGCADPQGMMQHVGMSIPHGMPPGMHPMDPSAHHHVYSAPPPMHLPPPMHQMPMGGPPGVLMAGPMMPGPMEQQQITGAIDQQMPAMIQEGDESMAVPVPEEMPTTEEPETPEVATEKTPRKKYMEMGDDELAMLGIDPEDMAAQTFAPKRPYP